MRGSAAFRTGVAPGGALAPGWVKNELWRKARTVPSLDLRFADNKSLVDATTGASLVTFTRASSGTFVGSDGVLGTAVTNLLLRSEEFSDASWGKVSTTVTANSEASPTGSVTADTLTWGALQTAEAYQAFTLTAATWTFSIYAKTTSGIKKFRLKYWNGTSELFSAEQTATTQWQRFSYTFTGVAVSGNVSVRNSNPAEAGDLIVWGAQLEQASTVGEYIPTTSTINSAPRFDHNPTTGESLGLLVEEARTNLLLRSEEFDNGSWSKASSSITANQGVAPDGNSTADKFAENTSNAYHQLSQVFSSAVSTVYTYSVYAKAAGRNLLVVSFNGTAITGTQVYCFFNLANGTVGPNYGTTSPSIVFVGNGWYRCSVTTTTLSSAGTAYAFLTTSQDSGSTLYVGDGTSGYLLWGAQLEAGAFPTSYIKTEAAAATRSADVASISSSAFSSWYRQDEGTVFAEGGPTNPTLNNTQLLITINDGSANNRMYLGKKFDSTTAVEFGVTSGGVGQAFILTAPSSVSNARLAVGYKVNDFAVASSGGALATDTSGSVPVSSTQLLIGTLDTVNNINGTIKRLVYWGQRLPNNVLQAITQ